ncbi:uncharacterized protein VTP21DRAFT_4700 [Calcarisporiella thermophila]|uniref:uncharacterized protein n=1 Tax=Calcarisporiella thermophila TaxID=911321 RepID=UPI0037449B0B
MTVNNRGTKRRMESKEAEARVKAARTSEAAQIHPFFTKMKERISLAWGERDGLMLAAHMNPAGNAKIAAFDLDGTLIKPKQGRRHPKDSSDWEWWNPVVPLRLRSLHEEGYKVVIFTNQGGLKHQKRKSDFKEKMNHVVAELNIPLQIFVATMYDSNRKPRTGMWSSFLSEHNSGIEVELEKSFYIGDAAGRAKGWKKGAPEDHACVDRKFADNIGISFSTPEEYFLDEPMAAFSWGDFDPRVEMEELSSAALSPSALFSEEVKQEMIIFVGYPASGKTYFAKKRLVSQGYVHINQDTLGTRQRCTVACKAALQEGKSVVIDNTNPTAEARRAYIQLAKQHNIPTRCFWFTASEALAKHNNQFRSEVQKANPVPEIAFRMYASKFEEPKMAEGFGEIIRVNFAFDREEEEEEKVGRASNWTKWRKWYL